VAQGHPPGPEGYEVHLVHLKPNSLAMGNKGRLLSWGPMSGTSTSPWVWDPYGGGTYGTWLETAVFNELPYQMFCSSQAIMVNGKVIACGSFFNTAGYPNNRVAVFDPTNNSWSAQLGFWMNKNRYYPTTITMPYGELLTAGGMGATFETNEPPEVIWIRDGPFEFNKNTTTGQSPWVLGTNVSYDFINYPQLFAISATEAFFVGPARHNTNNGQDYNTFSFPLESPLPDARVPLGGASDVWEASCAVMIRPRTIFKAGGYSGPLTGGPHPPASGRTEYFAVGSSIVWTTKATMNYPRIDFNLVLGPAF
jgi:hypothetical protein